MLLTITARGDAAPGLSHLLHKHPGKAQSFDLSVGTAHVFYPENTPDTCTAALLLEVDPIALARSRKYGADPQALSRYVNDRPYAATSMLAHAVGHVFRTALAGTSTRHPELARTPIDLEIALPAVRSERAEADGDGLATRLFAPLGWEVRENRVPLDDTRPEWGEATTAGLRLRGVGTLADALRQLTVLLPVLDDAKHYWVGDDEVGKLLRRGQGWLSDHPLRELIVRRSLAHQQDLARAATAALLGQEGDGEAPVRKAPERGLQHQGGAGQPPAEPPLKQLRADAVLAALRDVGARTVADVGCGEGALLRRLFADRTFTRIVGTDVSARELAKAERRLGLDEASDAQRDRVRLLQSSTTYTDGRIAGLDAVVLMEVVEHIDPERLPALEAAVFAAARPGAVVVTTPNSEHNVRYRAMAAGTFRHPDHRFEWTRAEFRAWAERTAAAHGYAVDFRPVGHDDPEVGPPTQLALFRHVDTTKEAGR